MSVVRSWPLANPAVGLPLDFPIDAYYNLAMLMTARVFDIVVKTKDDAYALALSAFNDSHALALSAVQNEIRYLKNDLENVKTQLKYEKARADNLVDRLLIKEAKVAAVSPMAIEAAKMHDEQAVKKLREVFDQLNDVAAEIPAKETRAFEFAGGGSAVRHHV